MRDWRARFILCAAFALVIPGASYGEVTAKLWSDIAMQDLGTSILFDVGQPGAWSIGPMASWQDNEDLDSDDEWCLGVQWEMQVDPNASVAVADWGGAIGEFLGLPETMTARTYVVGEGKVVQPFESSGDDLTGVFSIGPGVGVGPLYLEYVYQIVDGGGVPSLDLESGAVLRLGAAIKF